MTKLRITPIGTCRIHTPLRRASARYPVTVDLRRNYGFVHTSDEALQLLRFLQGEKTFGSNVAPLVFRDADPAQFETETWQPSDLHMVEISSSKRINCGPDIVQSNYVQRYFSDFFASRDRSRKFWGLVKTGHRQDLLAFLDAQPAFHLLSPEDRQLLGELSMEQLSFKAIKADMSEIVERLGRESVLFVTHINARTADGELIPTRDRLIRWVKMAAEQLNASVFDPTTIMDEVGQESALENGGLDLTHYNLPFSDRLYDAVHRSTIAGRIHEDVGELASDEDQRLGNLAIRLEADLIQGDFFAASREVHMALEEGTNALPLIELRGLIRSKIGDFSGALADLTHRGEEELLSHNLSLALLEALANRGQHEAALRVARRLLADEFEDAAVYRAAALAAEQSGRRQMSLQFHKEAFRRSRGDLATALRVLIMLRETSDHAAAREWRREVLDSIGTVASGAFELASWAVQNADDELFVAALDVVAAVDKGATIDLVEDAFNADMILSIAHAIPLLSKLGKLPTALSMRRNALLTKAMGQMETLLEADRPGDAFSLAQAALRLSQFPTSQIQAANFEAKSRRAMAQITRHVRSAVRTAFGNGDPDGVVAASEQTWEILQGDPDTAVIVARSLEAVDRRSEALDLLLKALADNPEHAGLQRFGARYAALEKDYATALDLYGKLRQSRDQPVIAKEVDRFFATVERRALKQLRTLTVAERYDDAIALSAIITRELGPLERTEREVALISRQLRLRLKDIDEGEGASEDRESYLRKMIDIDPLDAKYLRLLAVELMRQSRFSEAAEAWSRIIAVDPANLAADRNRVRCATLAERRGVNNLIEINTVG